MSSPISEHGYENDYTGVANFSPLYPELLITDQDGSVLRERQDFTVLHDIVRRNDTQTLKQYLEKGSWAIPRAPLVPRQLIGDNPDMEYFYVAACTGSLEALQMLLTHKAKEDLQSPEKIRFKHRRYELLHVAVRWGHFDMARFLLENQPLYADIHDRDYEEFTPILSAANFFNTQFLVPCHEEGVSPARSERVMNLLLDYGACATDALPPLRFPDAEKPFETVLSFAVRWAGSELIKRLIEAGADVRTKTTTTKWALGLGNKPEEDSHDVEALFIACSFANLDAVKTLVCSLQASMHNEDISHITSTRGSLPIHWAARNTLRAGEDEGWLLQEQLTNITAIIDFLLGLDPTTINAQDNDGNTPLHYAAKASARHKGLFAPVFTLLCDRGADASIYNIKGQTPLHTLFKDYEDEMRQYTCFTEEFVLDTSAVLILLAHGARIMDADDDGNTPLHLVSEILNYSNGVSLLLDLGADPSKQNAKQETALHRAARGSCLTMAVVDQAPERIATQDNVIGMLVKVGGEELMDVVDAEGKSPRQLCEEKREAWREHDKPVWERASYRSLYAARGRGGGRGGRGGRGG